MLSDARAMSAQAAGAIGESASRFVTAMSPVLAAFLVASADACRGLGDAVSSAATASGAALREALSQLGTILALFAAAAAAGCKWTAATATGAALIVAKAAAVAAAHTASGLRL
eukprot:1325127-Pleurochrysis_carterae.AAC.1